VAGADLLAQQVEAERRVNRADVRRVVVHAVVALGEHGDRGDVRGAQGMGKVLGVPVGADVWDGRRVVEIEVDLAQGEGGGVHGAAPVGIAVVLVCRHVLASVRMATS